MGGRVLVHSDLKVIEYKVGGGGGGVTKQHDFRECERKGKQKKNLGWSCKIVKTRQLINTCTHACTHAHRTK